MDEIIWFLRPSPPYKPKEGREDFIKHKTFVPGKRPKTKSRAKYKIYLDKYEMPDWLSKIFDKSEEDARRYLNETRLNPDEYKNFFTNLLYAEEHRTNEELKMYDRQRTTMRKDGNKFIMKMSGLAEKRPSVLRGDYILAVRCDEKKDVPYQGFVHEIMENSIVLKFGKEFLHKAYSSNAIFNVRFTFNRISMRRMHQALDNSQIDLNRLFPQNHEENISQDSIQDMEFDTYNPQNEYQKRAVAVIKSGDHHHWPFIVFGPPGTGKSATIVEAIWQLLDDDNGTRILACAASNAAADWLLKKLSERLPPEMMIRVNAISQDPDKLDSELHCYCMIGQNGKYQLPTLDDIERRKVVVTTCITAGAVYALGGTKYTHIFVDEAGQALEPEIVTALQNASEDTKIILAGDPEQLGPLVRSPVAKEFGLGKSLIERLATSEFYDFCETCIYGVKLRMNYRSHPEILNFPNAQFYENELESCADEDITHSLTNFSLLPTKGYPLMFWLCEGKEVKEQREGQSPSWFNAHEAAYVLAVVKQLQKENVEPREIGVVTPYVKQVEKIKMLLEKKEINGVDVGTVEKFQGQERRAIIISTVRTESVGFLGEPRRFCVAVTRAQALLVVIGNQKTLSKDRLWGEWLKEVRSKGGYSTKPFPSDVW